MSTFPARLYAAFVGVALLSWGCKPKIGDPCGLSTDCSTQGDRLCDTTAPGGYCTVFNCEPGRCAEEASCVAFSQQPASVCKDPQRWVRFQRTFCMRTCEGDDDCRAGYVCVGGAQLDQGWNARVVDGDGSKRVCVAAYSAPAPVEAPPAVCQPAPTNPPTLSDIPVSGLGSGTAGQGGDGGQGGEDGGGGASEEQGGQGGAGGKEAGGMN
ncbi:MAG: hypothetical protein RMJ98_08290 [Myxococcales bacterium]|nr:hypothetical protein [Polyangiaceae bacterium]MDW8249285.1 hypothetical protein [Myxococcales bacterium]